MSKQVMRQALDALQSCTYDEEGYCLIPDNEDAIAALRAALDAPEYVPLSDARIISLAYDCNAMPESCTDESLKLFARAIEQEVRGK